MDVYLAILVGSLGGGGIVAAIAKWLIQRALSDFENICKRIKEIDTSLAVLATKLDNLSKFDELLHTHDRQIASLEAKVAERRNHK